ncbi:MAG: bifunctional [glutamate--ammonia ligase]-adenylyl-L-tyrosine phosphorylase/[glutamate--ammonia-ligase] adenylyltransferase [Zoogloeaceae bacterium]|jgi:glutamate-ammonia-ligase adenylyltransferase|nr:bifunctional [glutamate--ammonia ligase]-adenylyl-L-tyrosine phosphorylase/[glutamate--ammonia-ligase] adenylyltransferase [Zoogloeaceae bacterium]
MPVPTDNAARLESVLPLSRFLSHLVESRPDIGAALRERLHLPWTEAEMRAFLADNMDAGAAEATLRPGLRRLRAAVLSRLAARDLAGLADLAEVTATMTTLAEIAIGRAAAILGAALTARHGTPRSASGEAQELIVIGMGKLGGGELNVSSDIDLIFVYPEDGETDGGSQPLSTLSNFEFFTRLGRQLIGALAEITGDGQVFRVDMRLRPNGESGPLVASFDMLENYFVTQGREWERYAWIKARPLRGEGGSIDAATALATLARPFVFRKYLDYGAINAMRELHAQIRREVARKDRAGDIKLGPGGIREIEFIAQVFQLIRGGRDKALQIRPTLAVLALLARQGLLEAAAADELAAAYRFLRNLEHRLQYLDDAQTHALPAQDGDQARIARGMGFDDYATLLEALERHRANVSRHFEAVFADPDRQSHGLASVWQGSENSGDGKTAQALVDLGYDEAEAGAQRLAGIRAGSRYQQMPPGIRERFDALVPRLIEAAAETPNPDATLTRGLDLLEAISRRAAYLALLQQYPHALRQVARLASASSWAADYLTRHPVLLDELLDARLREAAPDWAAFRAELAQALDAHEPDTEQQMDLMREAHHAQVFRLLTQDLAGLLSVEKLADHLSELADIMLDLALRLVWRKLPKRHRETPRFAIVAYGKLGGKELGYASDLDIIFLFEDDHPDAPEIYARLAQRINTWISSATPAGILFQTDLRLRPNGESGLLVSAVDAFRQYQMTSAWVWEHQALTRARFCAGDADIGRSFEAIRIEVLCQPRPLAELRREVIAMRGKMAEARANKSALFDLKHDRGGLIDVEFIVQYLVLGHAHAHAELTGNLGNLALLRIAAGLGLIPADLAERVHDAYRAYRKLQHGLRLNGARYARVERETLTAEIGSVRALWQTVFGND